MTETVATSYTSAYATLIRIGDFNYYISRNYRVNLKPISQNKQDRLSFILRHLHGLHAHSSLILQQMASL